MAQKPKYHGVYVPQSVNLEPFHTYAVAFESTLPLRSIPESCRYQGTLSDICLPCGVAKVSMDALRQPLFVEPHSNCVSYPLHLCRFTIAQGRKIDCIWLCQAPISLCDSPESQAAVAIDSVSWTVRKPTHYCNIFKHHSSLLRRGIVYSAQLGVSCSARRVPAVLCTLYVLHGTVQDCFGASASVGGDLAVRKSYSVPPWMILSSETSSGRCSMVLAFERDAIMGQAS